MAKSVGCGQALLRTELERPRKEAAQPCVRRRRGLQARRFARTTRASLVSDEQLEGVLSPGREPLHEALTVMPRAVRHVLCQPVDFEPLVAERELERDAAERPHIHA